jgi:hypothetical protein
MLAGFTGVVGARVELVFEVPQEADGGYFAECLMESIFTQADSWDEFGGTSSSEVLSVA